MMTETTEAVANFSKIGERGLMNNIGHKGGDLPLVSSRDKSRDAIVDHPKH